MKKNYKVFRFKTLDWIVFSTFVRLKNVFIMSNIYSYILSFTTLLTLTTCSAVQTLSPSTEQEVVIVPPSTDIPLPSVEYIFLQPTPELGKTEYARKDITENFSPREKADIAVPDPKLLCDENSLIIDLGLISKEDYAFPLPGAKVISAYARSQKTSFGSRSEDLCQRYYRCPLSMESSAGLSLMLLTGMSLLYVIIMD